MENHSLFSSWELCAWRYSAEQQGVLPRYFCRQSTPGLEQNLGQALRYFWIFIHISWAENSICSSLIDAATWKKSRGMKAGLAWTTAVPSWAPRLGPASAWQASKVKQKVLWGIEIWQTPTRNEQLRFTSGGDERLLCLCWVLQQWKLCF